MSIYDKYDKVAQTYESRLQAASAAEEARNRELWDRTKADTEAQLGAQTDLAYRDVGGAAVGQGAMGLRSAAYASDQIGQQRATEQAYLDAMADQAYREQLMGVLGRRGEYAMTGQDFAADQYAVAAQEKAYQEAKKAREEAQKAEETAGYIGAGMGMLSAGMMGSKG
jgi:hypothetical protein